MKFSDPVGSPDLERTQAANELLHLNSAGAIEAVPSEVLLNGSYSVEGKHEDPLMISAVTPPDAAFSRWFGLLVEDADYTTGIVPGTISNINSDGRMLSVAPSTLQSDNGIIEGRQNWVELQLDSDSRYCSSPEVTRDQLSRRQPWRGSEPSKFLPHEQDLFGNFIRHVSTWVCIFNSLDAIFAKHFLLRLIFLIQHNVFRSSFHIWRLVHPHHLLKDQKLTFPSCMMQVSVSIRSQ